MNIDRLETARLRCERLTEQDAPDLGLLMRDPRVASTTWAAAGEPSEREVADWLEDALAHWREHRFGLWLLRDRATGAMVGRGGLQHTAVDGHDEVEIAWAIVPERWGEGLATELARNAVEIGFGRLGLQQLVVLTLPDNLASRRVAEKAGFALAGETEHAGLAHVLYRLSAH